MSSHTHPMEDVKPSLLQPPMIEHMSNYLITKGPFSLCLSGLEDLECIQFMKTCKALYQKVYPYITLGTKWYRLQDTSTPVCFLKRIRWDLSGPPSTRLIQSMKVPFHVHTQIHYIANRAKYDWSKETLHPSVTSIQLPTLVESSSVLDPAFRFEKLRVVGGPLATLPLPLMQSLCRYVHASTSLRELDLSGYLKVETCMIEPFYDALSVTQSLQILSLNENYMNHSQIVKLSNALMTNTSLHTLNLRRNNLSDVSATVLATLCATKRMQRLDVSHNIITASGAYCLASTLTVQPTLIKFLIHDNPLQSDGWFFVLQAFRSHTQCKTVSASNSDLFQSYNPAWLGPLTFHHTLTSLDLSYQWFVTWDDPVGRVTKLIDPDDLRFLFQTLVCHVSLRHLDLSRCTIDNYTEFYPLLSQSLRLPNVTLTSLDLSYSTVSHREVLESLFDALCINTSLTSLVLSGHTYSTEALCRMLKTNTTLQRLTLHSTKVENIHMTPLASALYKNKTLLCLDVSGNESLTYESMRMFIQYFPSPVIRRIYYTIEHTVVDILEPRFIETFGNTWGVYTRDQLLAREGSLC